VSKCGLVMSGGGVRGAYQAGVLGGIVEVLNLKAGDGAPFQLFAGTSIGALNTAYTAANANVGHLDTDGLMTVWSTLRLEEMVNLRPWSLARDLVRGVAPTADSKRSLADPDTMAKLVAMPELWEQLRRNIDEGVVNALFIATLEVATGRTALFADLTPGFEYTESPDPRRVLRRTQMNLEHLMASAAIPVLLPARRIEGGLYVDGGLRFNTPISPVLRAGADKVVVISMIDRARPLPATEVGNEEEQSLLFLMGKLINAVLLDPMEYDLAILDRINGLMATLEEVLGEDQLRKVADLLEHKRGAAYRKVDTLLFTPSEDIGLLAGHFIHDHADRWKKGTTFLHRVLRRSAAIEPPEEADWASFVLFDGQFCERLIDVGRGDVLARADDVKRFFDA
jgi:NTE family protein